MLTIEVDDRVFRQYLAQLQGRLADLTPVMQSIGQELEGRIKGRFETETDPSGAPWAPWAPSTQESYPDDGNARILDRYGDMLGDLNWDADASSVRVGFPQRYATFHEFGTKHMPRRGLLFDDPEAGRLAEGDERAVLDLLQDWLLPD